MQSRVPTRELQLCRVDSADYRRSAADSERWRDSGSGGALERFLTAALAGILTLVFAWRILLGVEEAEVAVTDAGKAGRTTVSGGDARVRCAVASSIDEPGVGGADPDLVTHGNAATSRVPAAPTSQLGAGGRRSLPGNWTPSSARADRWSIIDSGAPVISSRNCAVAEVCSEQVPLSDASLECSYKFPLVIRRSGGPTHSRAMLDDTRSPAATMSNADRHDGEVPRFRRRPLTWTTSESCSDEEPVSPWNSDELSFFHALMAQDDGDSDDDGGDEDRRLVPHDADDETDNLPEVTSSTWISLFRTYFMDAAGQQQRSAAARPTPQPISRQLQDRDGDDLLDRTLSTITEEGADEWARKLSEMDDDLADAELTAWQRELEDEMTGSSHSSDGDTGSRSSDDDEAENYGYYDISISRSADDVLT